MLVIKITNLKTKSYLIKYGKYTVCFSCVFLLLLVQRFVSYWVRTGHSKLILWTPPPFKQKEPNNINALLKRSCQYDFIWIMSKGFATDNLITKKSKKKVFSNEPQGRLISWSPWPPANFQTRYPAFPFVLTILIIVIGQWYLSLLPQTANGFCL